MTYEKSNQEFNNSITQFKSTFLSKGAEYSINGIDDRFHHFRLMVNKHNPNGVRAEAIAKEMVTLRSKQEVCIDELISFPEKLVDSKMTKEYIDEKFNDFIIYTMLLKLLVIESYGIEVEKEI